MTLVENGGARPVVGAGRVDLDPYESIAATARPKWRSGMTFGYAVIIGFFGILGGFAAFAPLASSVIAPGSVRVDRDPRIIQHPSGGVVEELRVREGQHVRKGDVLLTLDPTTGVAEREILRKRYYGGLITQARLEAERDGAETFTLPAEVLDEADDPAILEMIDSEQDLLTSRVAARAGEIELLREQITQTEIAIGASQERLSTLDEEIRLIDEELEGVRELYEKGLERISRVRSLERGKAGLKGARAAMVGDIARFRERLGEYELRILQSKRQTQADLLAQLDAVQRQIREAGERLPVTERQFSQLVVKAPTTGRIVRLMLNTEGAVIGAGQVLMEIVPDDEELVVVARVKPRDIDALNNAKGDLNVTVRLTAFSQRFTHPVEGELIQVSADVTKSDAGSSFYRADVRLDKTSLKNILRDQELVSGMPATVMLGVGEKTLLTYLLDPLIRSFDAALREP